MHTLTRILAAVVFLCAGACHAQPPTGRMLSVTGTLDLPEGGICSATAISRKAFATAAHCMKGVTDEIRFRGINYRIIRVERDGNDHALVIVDGDLGAFARVGRPPRLNDDLWMVGNPMGLPQVLRRGYVAKVTKTEILLDCRCWNGDSGMALFNEYGQLVSVFSGAYTQRGMLGSVDYTFPVFFPLAFTDKQWRAARD
jgi:hypothetical protein